jgi:hypothetical protein
MLRACYQANLARPIGLCIKHGEQRAYLHYLQLSLQALQHDALGQMNA